MFPFIQVAKLLIQVLPRALFDPGSAYLFWIVAFLVFSQYRRMAAAEHHLYGMVRLNPLRETLHSVAYGFFGGLVGSLLLVTLGVAFTPDSQDFIYLWGVAVALALVSPRLMCFSYAGGLVALSHLLFGWPRISVPQVIALVAILHVVESALIWLHGSSAASPVSLRNRQGEVVGGFTVQRFWPVPFTLMLMLSVADPALAGGSIAMPDWWPLIRVSPHLSSDPNLVFALFPVVAGMGYGDLAVTMQPEHKAGRTALNLAVFSAILLGLAVLASHYRPFMWLAAIFSPLGHEAVARLGSRTELKGKPYYGRLSVGVKVLDVFPGTPAAAAGISRGTVIIDVDGVRVNSREELRQALAASPAYAKLTFVTGARVETCRVGRDADHEGALGLVLVPEPHDQSYLVMGAVPGPLRRLFGWLRRRVGGGPR